MYTVIFDNKAETAYKSFEDAKDELEHRVAYFVQDCENNDAEIISLERDINDFTHLTQIKVKFLYEDEIYESVFGISKLELCE